MANELELKLQCNESLKWDQVRAVLLELPYVQCSSVSSSSLQNTYFDTDDLQLHQQKVALRIRRKGERFIQTLKTAGQSLDGVSSRGEWEWVLDEPVLDLAALNSVDVWREQLELHASQLKPIFNTDFKRTAQEIAWEGYRFEVVLDEGFVHVPNTDKSLPLHEIEIEYLSPVSPGSVPASVLVGSPEAAMRSLSAKLCARLPLAPADISKAQRGYALFKA